MHDRDKKLQISDADFEKSLHDRYGGALDEIRSLTGAWSDLNQAVGGDLYKDPEKLGSMRLVALRPEFSNEGVDGTLSGGFKQAVLDQIEKIQGLSVEERQRLRDLGENSMIVSSDAGKNVGHVNALSYEQFARIQALSRAHDAGSEPS